MNAERLPQIAPHLFGAPAKLNLFLDVLDRRADGYHDVCMVNVSASLVDFLRIETRSEPGLELRCNWEWLPTDERNLVTRGVSMLVGERLREVGLRIDLYKCIPAGAGLGGGTADAAVAMVWLNDLLRIDLPRDELLALGKQVGADVPYSMIGGAALVRGIGEQVTPLVPASGEARGIELDCWLLIVDPGLTVATGAAYALLDAAGPREHPSPEAMVAALTAEDFEGVCDHLYNAFQPVIAAAFPPIQIVVNRLRALGARGVIMAGSGSHVVGLFGRHVDVMRAEQACRADGVTCYVARPRSWPWSPDETSYDAAQRLSETL